MARLKILIAGAVALALGGCEGAQGNAPTAVLASAPEPASVLYRCDNGATLRVTYPDAETAVAGYQSRNWTLTRVRSTSGARYVTEGLQWWAKGGSEGEVTTLGVGDVAGDAPGFRCIASSGASGSPPLAAASAPDTKAAQAAGGAVASVAPQAPADLAQAYFALIEQRNYARAQQLWADDGRASGMDEAAFAASFDRYGAYHANVGAPGAIQRADDGALYVEIPVQVYGRLKTGAPMTLLGSVGLKRSPPGAGPGAWRIAASDLKATVAGAGEGAR